MKNSIFFLSLFTISFFIACTNYPTTTESSNNSLTSNVDGTITIQGKVSVYGSDLPPVGISSVTIANKWVFESKNKMVKGDNEKVYIDKNGFYRITINKNDTIKLVPSYLFYKTNLPQYALSNLDKSQVINFTVYPDSTAFKNVYNYSTKARVRLEKFIKNASIDTLVTVAGTVTNTKKKPLINLPVSASFLTNSMGVGTYHTTNEAGQFIIVVPKNTPIRFNPLSRSRTAEVLATQDTIINISI